MPVWVLLILIPLHDGSYLSEYIDAFGTKVDCLQARREYIEHDQMPVCVEIK